MIRAFLMNLLLAAVYIFLTGEPTLFNFLIGFFIGWAVLLVYGLATGEPDRRHAYTHRLLEIFTFCCYFVRVLIVANLQVAWEIITPGLNMTPRIIRYSVEGMTEVQITTLANAITLTPGTLTCDVDEDTQQLYIHCMYAKDREKAVGAIDELRDRLMREVFGE